MSPLSTREVAAIVGIHRATLEEWLGKGRLQPPKLVRVGGKSYRIWTDNDIERVKKHKAHSYRKGRGRKKKSATK